MAANTNHIPTFAAGHHAGGYTRPYDVEFSPQLGWTKRITLRDEYRLFKRMPQFSHWTRADHVQASETHRLMAGHLAVAHNALVQIGIETYGMNGPMISGGFHDDWPSEVKDVIRSIAHKVARQRDISLSHWRAAGRTTKTWSK